MRFVLKSYTYEPLLRNLNTVQLFTILFTADDGEGIVDLVSRVVVNTESGALHHLIHLDAPTQYVECWLPSNVYSFRTAYGAVLAGEVTIACLCNNSCE